MEGSERDTTQDWLLPAAAAPPLLSELERRIDEAVATARVADARSLSAEATVMTVGAAALDAADQARQAAELAKRAAATGLDAQRRVERRTFAVPDDESMRRFSERADRIVERLRGLERLSEATRTAAPQGGRSPR